MQSLPRASFCLRIILGLLLHSFANLLHAEQSGIYTYTVSPENTITITKASNPTGAITVPAAIDGRPVTSIGESAFSHCSALISLTLPDSLSFIGNYAFSYCTGLTNLTLPVSLASIGDSAFYYCRGLTTVVLPSSLASIGNHAFTDCRNLTSVNLPPTLTSIQFGTFSLCSSLAGINLPASITSIGESAFHGCSGLTTAILPASLTSIGKYAFHGCSRLTEISLPASLTSIGAFAFSYCTELTAFLPSSESQTYSSLNGVLFNKNQTTLVAFPAGIGGAYIIPATVSSLAETAFHGCPGITAFYAPPENESYSTLNGVLFSKNQTQLIAYPAGIESGYAVPSTVTSIRAFAFSTCIGLTGITLPAVLSSIENYAFSSCSGLTSVILPASLTSLGNYAFYNCENLASMTLPAFLTSIGDFTFYGCQNLTSITLPPSLTNIGRYAFSYCNGLIGITLPSSLVSIGLGAFSSCSGLTSLTLPSSITSIQGFAFWDCPRLTRLIFLGNAPTAIDSISPLSPGITTYWLSSKWGFTAPTWKGYPAVRINENVYPAASWLLRNNLPYDTHLQQDPDGDGVSYLMAYALDLDPQLNLSASLPVPVLGPDTLSLTFHAAAAGITYQAETSTGLGGWTTEGVTLSPIGPDQRRTASVGRDGPKRYLRLKVAD